MASPFSVFRKHRTMLLAVSGVVLMIAFVVLPIVLQMQDNFGGRRGRGDAVMSWSRGELTAEQVINLQHIRREVANFIKQVMKNAQAIDPQASPQAIPISEDNNPETVVRTMLLAQKGRDMGLVVSDQAIKDYLVKLSDNVLKSDADFTLAKNQSIGRKKPIGALYDALREELLAQKVIEMASQGMIVTTPAAAWDYHNRMHREVTAEFVAFPVDEFVAQVSSKPTDAELEALYEEHKNFVPFPNSPEPGFKRRMRADFQFLAADFNKFRDEEKKKITPEQIAKYYEENKERYVIPELPTFDEDDPRQAKPNPPTPPEEDEAQSVPPEGNDATPPDSTDSPAAPPQPQDPPPGVPGDQGETGESGEAAPPADTGAAGDEKQPENSSAENPSPADPDKPATNDPPAETPGTSNPGTTPEDDLTAPPPKPKKYKPLAEVEDQIRLQLALEPAQKRLDEAIATVRQKLLDYQSQAKLFEGKVRGISDPGKFKYRELAAQFGLQAGETGMKDALQLDSARKEFPIADSYVQTPRGRYPFEGLAYDEGLQTYQAVQTQLHTDKDEDLTYISWKVAQEPARVPPLAEIKPEVELAWKTKHARDLARKAAEKFAADLDRKQPLAGQAGGRKVIAPKPFSYFDPISVLTLRWSRQPPQPMEIEGIEEAASDAIRKEVVKMPVGAVKVLPNAGQSTYYVARVLDEGEDSEKSRAQFMQSIVDNEVPEGPPLQLVYYVGGYEQQALQYNWLRGIMDEFQLKWLDVEFLQQHTRRQQG